MRTTYAIAVMVLAAVLLLGGVLGSGSEAAPTSHRPWEYRQVHFHGDYPTLEQTLTELGAMGFELVLISPQETVAIFKRPR